MREMKDSEVEWIGEIPRDWRIAKFKFFFSIIGGCGFKEEYQGASQGDYPFLKASDINGSDRTVSSAKNYVNQDLVQQERYSIVPAYSIIIAKIGEALKKNHRKINTCDCIIDNNCEAFSLISSADSDLSYLYYVLSQIDMVWFDNGGTVPSINNEKLRDFFLPNPNNATQHRIADYLDAKCTQIDRAIARQQEVIEKLKAYKLSVITEAVTKGLNPDVPMKDSGIEWIGEIPEHWEVKKMARLIDQTQNGLTRRDLSESTGQIVLKLKNITAEGQIDFSDCNRIEMTEFEKSKYILEEGDFLFVRVNGSQSLVGKCAMFYGFPEVCAYNDHIIRVQLGKDCHREFVHWFFQSESGKREVELHINTAAGQYTISGIGLRNIKITFPTLEEQRAIDIHLVKSCDKIDSLLIRKRGLIDKLTEYRKSLIYEVVTGKREV